MVSATRQALSRKLRTSPSVKWLSAALAVCSFAFAGPLAQAAGFPEKPIHVIVGFPAGGSTDFLGRYVSQKLAERFGQPVLVENREGADGTIAETYVANAPADGYTLAVLINTHTVTPNQIKLSYDPIKSFAPISLMEWHPEILVINPAKIPVKTLKEFVDLAKSKPGSLNFGSGGTSTPPYLIMSRLLKATGIDMVNITYKGTSPMVFALLGGEIQSMFGSIETALAQVQAGTLRALVITSKDRSPLMPDVPTMAEAVGIPDFLEGTWVGMAAPAGTPKDVIKKLNENIAAILVLPETKEIFDKRGFGAVGSTPEEFGKFIEDDLKKWASLMSNKN